MQSQYTLKSSSVLLSILSLNLKSYPPHDVDEPDKSIRNGPLNDGYDFKNFKSVSVSNTISILDS